MRFRLLPLLALCASSAAVASDLPVPYQHVEYKQTGNVFEWKPLTKTGPGTGGVVFRGDTTISTAEPKISTLSRLPYDKRPDADIPAAQKARVTSPITKASFGKALTLAGKIAWPIGVIMHGGEIVDFLKSLGYQNIKNTADGIAAEKLLDYSEDGFEYSTPWHQSNGSAVWHNSKTAACQAGFSAMASHYSGTWAYAFMTIEGGSGNFECVGTATFKTNPPQEARVLLSSRTKTTTGTESVPVTQQEIESEIASKPDWGQREAAALRQALNIPGVTLDTGSPTVSGPSSIPGTTTTTTQPTQVIEGTTTETPAGTPGAQAATKTTTTTNTVKNTYIDNKVTTNTTTTTTTNITNNITNTTNTTTDKEQTTDEAPKDESSPTDTPLGPIPELYTRKYPDGMVGIWNEKKEQLKQSSVSQLVDQLLPKNINSGSCPRFDLNLNFATWANYGTRAIDYPCWIWTVAKSIIIVSALILARALVFGG